MEMTAQTTALLELVMHHPRTGEALERLRRDWPPLKAPAHLGRVTKPCRMVMTWLRKWSLARNGNELARRP
ncbi:hypothetical protein AOLI_G00310480 [Acnodon oligacanthus]